MSALACIGLVAGQAQWDEDYMVPDEYEREEKIYDD